MSSILLLTIKSPSTYSQRQFSSNISLAQLKNRLEPITGIPANLQVLVGLPQDDSLDLINAGLFDGSEVQVDSADLSVSSHLEQFQDVSQVEKFELSTEEYAKRSDTVRAFKERNKLGRFGDNDQSAPVQKYSEEPNHIKVDQRCELRNKDEQQDDGLVKRGLVKFVGTTSFATGYWIGVLLDEPYGKNNGSINGTSYFEAPPKRGIFVRPDALVVGDYPELDIFDDDDEVFD